MSLEYEALKNQRNGFREKSRTKLIVGSITVVGGVLDLVAASEWVDSLPKKVALGIAGAIAIPGGINTIFNAGRLDREADYVQETIRRDHLNEYLDETTLMGQLAVKYEAQNSEAQAPRQQ